MAKKRSGGSSGIGLIITLVFFILTTVILGVTTYMGYSEIEKEKTAAKKAGEESKKAEAERDWWRFNAWMSREYMGDPIPDLPKELDKDQRAVLLQNKQQFDAGSLSFAKGRPGEPALKAFIDRHNKDMPWRAPAELAPAKTYETRLAQQKKDYDDLADRLRQTEGEKQAALDEARRAKADLAAAEKAFANAVDKGKKDAIADLKMERDRNTTLQADRDQQNQRANNLLVDKKNLETDREKLENERRKLTGKLAEKERERRELEVRRDELDDQLRQIRDKFPASDTELTQERLKAKELEALRNWPAYKKEWRIIRLDQKGDRPYINLGSSDGLKPQVTFSIHALDRNDKLIEKPKGTLEVVEILGPHLARTRITQRADAINDPILAKDRLFNATWGPGQSKRVAIAGIADLGGEGIDSAEQIRRVLRRQGVIVDAYIDLRDLKQPELKNEKGEKGDLTGKTDYLIIGEGLDSAKHPRAKDKNYSKRFDELVAELRAKAKANGVTELSLKRYLEMIGFRARTNENAQENGR